MNEENTIEEEIEQTNEISYVENTDSVYDIAVKINTTLSVLTFVVVIVFVWKILRSCTSRIRK